MSINFWDLLHQRQDELTKSGRAVADYLLQHADEAQYQFRFIFEEPKLRDEEVRMIAAPDLAQNASSDKPASALHQPNEAR